MKKYYWDLYPITNCEITQLLWDNIPLDSDDNIFFLKNAPDKIGGKNFCHSPLGESMHFH